MSETSSDQSPMEIRQEIAAHVLKYSREYEDIPAVRIYVEKHHLLSEQIAAVKIRKDRLLKAKEKFIPFENKVLDSDTALKKTMSELQALYLPLGKATYQAFLDGLIKNKRILTDRIAVHKRIDNLQQQHDRLIPNSNASITLKGKSKAQQLIIAGKIKYEESSFGKLDKDIGRQLIEEIQEESVRCDLTIKLLDQIAFYRDEISKLTFENQVATKELAKIKKKTSEAVPLEHIENSKTFDAEYSFCEGTIRKLENAIEKERLLMIEALSEVDSAILPDKLSDQLDLLRSVKNMKSDHAQVTKRWLLESRDKATSLTSIYHSIGNRFKVISGIIICIILVGIIYWQQPSPSPQKSVANTHLSSTSSSDDHLKNLNSQENIDSILNRTKTTILPQGSSEVGKVKKTLNSNSDNKNPAQLLSSKSKTFTAEGILSEEYCPHKIGAIAKYTDSTSSSQSVRYEFYPDDIIRLFVNGRKEGEYLRKDDMGFINLIEVQKESIHIRIKKGAKSGDSWKYKYESPKEYDNRDKSISWKLLGFETYTTKLDSEKRSVAVIEETEFRFGRIVSTSIIRLLKGVGLLERKTQELQNPISQYRLIENTENLSSAEIAFIDSSMVKENVYVLSQPSKLIDDIFGNKAVASHLEFSPDGGHLICSKDGIFAKYADSVLLRMSNLNQVRGGLYRTFSRNGKYTYGVYQDSQGIVSRHLSSTNSSPTFADGLFITEVKTGKPIMKIGIGRNIGIGTLRGFPFEGIGDSFVEDSSGLVFVNEADVINNRGINILTIQGTEIGIIKPRSGQNDFSEAAVSPNGQQMTTIGRATQGSKMHVDIWDLKTRIFIKSLKYNNETKAYAPEYSKTGKYLVMRMGDKAGRKSDGNIVLLDTSDWTIACEIPQEERTNYRFGTWGADGNSIATIEGSGRTARVETWNILTGKRIQVIDVEGSTPFYFSANGLKVLASVRSESVLVRK